MSVTHATPAPLYAHSADRTWECEANMPDAASGCKDIARQLVEDLPGRNLNVSKGWSRLLVEDIPGRKLNVIMEWSRDI